MKQQKQQQQQQLGLLLVVGMCAERCVLGHLMGLTSERICVSRDSFDSCGDHCAGAAASC